MAGDDVRIGPFVGGLNTLSDSTSIADNEVTELINFELDIDGSLVNRPPIAATGVKMPLPYTTGAVSRTNLASNPQPVSATNWSTQSGTGEVAINTVVSTPGAGPEGRTGFFRRSVTTAKTAGLSGIFYREAASALSGVAGDIRTGSVWYRSSVESIVQFSMTFRLSGVSLPGGSAWSASTTIPANTWTRLSITHTAPSTFDAIQVYPAVQPESIIPIGETFDASSVLIEVGGSLKDYFDGSDALPENDAAWTGTANASTSTLAPWVYSGNMKVLGYYVTGTGVPYLIGSDGTSKTFYFDGTTWTLITATFAASAICQFRDKVYMLAPVGSVAPGGTWSIAGGFATEPNMPRGACIIECKERLWIGQGKLAGTNGTRLYLSDIVAAAPSWPAVPQYINIGSGDGQNIVDLTMYFSDIVIFKQGSTYRYSFASDPAAGNVTKVSATIGAADTGCFAEYEGELYVLFDNKVYLFSNYNFDRLNIKVPLTADNPSVLLSEYNSISVWSDRIFVAFYDKTYVYSIRTRTWSQWSSAVVGNIGRIFRLPGAQADQPTAYTYSTTPQAAVLYRIIDRIGLQTELMSCSVRTKNFDFQSPAKYKRLFGWGADVIARQEISATVSPVNYSVGVTWDQLAAYTWDQLAMSTWDRPLDISIDVSDSVSVAGFSGGRKFVRFLKSLRFRQVAFRLVATTDGSTTSAPIRLFSIVAYVKDKQRIGKRVS